MKKSSKILVKLGAIFLIALVLISTVAIPCFASSISSGYSYTCGTPITLDIGGVATNLNYKYLVNGYNEIYTNGSNASAMLDDTYINDSFTIPSGYQFIDHKVISFADSTYTNYQGEFISYDYTMYSHTIGDAEMGIRQMAYSESFDNDRIIDELREAYSNYDFYESAVSHLKIPRYKVDTPMVFQTMSSHYMPSTFYYSFFGKASNLDTIFNGVEPRFSVSFKLSNVDISGELVTTDYAFNNVKLDTQYYRLVNYNYNPSGDPTYPTNIPFRTIEDYTIDRVVSYCYGLNLYSLEFDFLGIAEYLRERIDLDSVYGVITDFSFYVDFSFYDDNAFLLDIVNDYDLTLYYNLYKTLPCYSFGTVNQQVHVSNPKFHRVEGTRELIYSYSQLESHLTQYEVVYLEDFNIFSWLGDTLGSILDVEIIGSITLSQILYIVVGIGVTIMFLKIFSGG